MTFAIDFPPPLLLVRRGQEFSLCVFPFRFAMRAGSAPFGAEFVVNRGGGKTS